MFNPTIDTNSQSINTAGATALARETMQTWIVNDIAIHLIKDQNLLKYETISISGEKLKTDTIPLPPNSDLDQIITDLKKCKALLDTGGAPVFVETYKRWEVDNQEIDLVHGDQDLLWLIYCNSTKRTSVFTVKEATIPSAQCHSSTIDLIEKIKSNALTITHVRHLQNDFEVTRILDENQVQSEQSRFDYDRRREGLDSEKHLNNMYREGLGVGLFAGYAGLSASWGSICAATSAVSASFGGGVLGGAIAGSCVGVPLTLGAGVVLPIAAAAGYISYSFLNRDPPRITNTKTERRIDMMLPRKRLFVEIEPISILSRIDDNVRVSKFMWAVGLITHEGSEGNHAQIIVEGISDEFYGSKYSKIKNVEMIRVGEKFTYMCEFNPPVESTLFLPEQEIPHETRTPLHMRTSEQVKKMIEAIEKEKLENPKFNLWGKKSIIYKFNLQKLNLSGRVGDNCLTWSREKLKMVDIDIGNSIVDYVAAIAKNYTKEKEECKKFYVQQVL